MLFKHYGYEQITSIGVRGLFYELRTLEVVRFSLHNNVYHELTISRSQVTVCLTIFRDSFLSSSPWKYAHQDADSPTPQSHLQDLFSIVFDLTPILPGLMDFRQVDTVLKDDGYQRLEKGLHYMESLMHAFQCIEEWYRALQASPGVDQLYHQRPAAWNSFGETCFSSSYTFSDFSIAMAVIFFDAIRIRMLGLLGDTYDTLRQIIASSTVLSLGTAQQSLLDEVQDVLSRSMVHESAIRICQSMEYFFAADKALIGPNSAMFPFHIAHSAFRVLEQRQKSNTADYAAKLSWCRMVSAKYGEAKLPSLESLDVGKRATSGS